MLLFESLFGAGLYVRFAQKPSDEFPLVFLHFKQTFTLLQSSYLVSYRYYKSPGIKRPASDNREFFKRIKAHNTVLQHNTIEYKTVDLRCTSTEMD